MLFINHLDAIYFNIIVNNWIKVYYGIYSNFT